jgi:hypothetical protein
MTIDKEQCPVCGENSYLDGKCYSCGYDDSMSRKLQYNIGITAPAAANGTIAGTYLGGSLTNGDDLPYGAEIVFTASANPTGHKQFITWVITGTGNFSTTGLTENPIKITIYGDVTITATFATKKALTIAAYNDTRGEVTIDIPSEDISEVVNPSGDVYYLDVNTPVTLTAWPEFGFEFKQWYSEITENPLEILAFTDDFTYTAVFDEAYEEVKLTCIDDKDGAQIPLSGIENQTIVSTSENATTKETEVHIDTT